MESLVRLCVCVSVYVELSLTECSRIKTLQKYYINKKKTKKLRREIEIEGIDWDAYSWSISIALLFHCLVYKVYIGCLTHPNPIAAYVPGMPKRCVIRVKSFQRECSCYGIAKCKKIPLIVRRRRWRKMTKSTLCALLRSDTLFLSMFFISIVCTTAQYPQTEWK